jgi:hypothetical protein
MAKVLKMEVMAEGVALLLEACYEQGRGRWQRYAGNVKHTYSLWHMLDKPTQQVGTW